jgi:rhomboid family GlyGly-CTERM serine protease
MYSAESTAQGQWWRPFSAWVAQLNLRHWLLNQWGVLVMLVLLPKQIKWTETLGFAVIWVFCSIALWLSDYANYVGLSGLLYGWLIFAAVLSPFYSNTVKLIFIAALSVKVFAENGILSLPGSDWVGDYIGAEVAHLSHLWGLLSGYVVIVIRLIVRRWT